MTRQLLVLTSVCSLLLQAVDGHYGEYLVDGPCIGQRLEEREVAEVLVGAARGVKPRMGIVMNGHDAVDGDVGRQQGIETMHQAINVLDGLCGVEVGDHQAGINTSVGAARTSDGSRYPQERSHSLLDALLHRAVMGLNLPSMELLAPIAESDKVSHDRSS